MNICFLVWSPDISGGTNVIFEHATRLFSLGNNVTMVTADKISNKRLAWFPGAEKLSWKTYDEVSTSDFDLAIATWWRTVFFLERVKSKNYAYFVQSIESRFYPEDEKVLRNLVEQTYTLQLNFITEATWIKDYLYQNYGINAFLVKNGIRKEYFNKEIRPISERTPGKTRLLIEGPLNVPFKNTELALKIAKKSDADEIWLLTSSPIGAISGVDKLFSRVPISKVGEIYASCDILIKLSTVEGMFGPPLEAFHCGCTSVSYDVTGYDEYIEHNVNALVSFSRNDEEVLSYINQLCNHNEILDKLKLGALSTANNWPDWDESSNIFKKVCETIIISNKKNNYVCAFSSAKLMIETYSIYEKTNQANDLSMLIKLRFKVLNYVNNNFPSLFFMLRKFKYYLTSKSKSFRT
nr:putative glycosyltransferase [Vibrio mimicus]